MGLHVSPTAAVAVTTGVAGAVWSSGVIAGLSLIGCPAALGLSGSSATVWAGLYTNGIAIMPKVAALVASSHLFAAYESRKSGGSMTGYVAAAVLALSIVPYTMLTMRPTNDTLLSIAAGSGQHNSDEVTRLINRWAILNLGRSILPLAGAVVGFWTFYQNTS